MQLLFTKYSNNDIVLFMERFLWMVRSAKRYIFDVRVVYALVGIIASICAHELVHVAVNMGSIQAVHFFPSLDTIVAMDVNAASGYSVMNEEIIAYVVMVLVQFVVIIDVFAIHDSRDKKTIKQSVYGSFDDLSEYDAGRLLQLITK